MGKELLNLDKLKQVHSGNREPLQSWKWYIKELPIIGGRTIPTSYCENINLPFAGFNTDSKEIAGTTVVFAGTSSIDGFEMQVYEDVSVSSIGYFLDWQSLVQNPATGGFRVPKYYWKNIDVVLMDNFNRDIATATLRNVWPVMISPIDLAQESNRVILSVQMACTAQIFNPVRKLSY